MREREMTTEVCKECRREFPIGIAERKYRKKRTLHASGHEDLYCNRQCAAIAGAKQRNEARKCESNQVTDTKIS